MDEHTQQNTQQNIGENTEETFREGADAAVSEDISFEPDEEYGEGGDAVKRLREKLKLCRQERMEYLTGWQRAKADYANARREEENGRGEFMKMANKGVLLDMVAVLDNFEHAQADKEAWEKVDKNWRIGIEYIYSQLLGVLEKHGLSPLSPLGEKFDPKLHASVRSVPAKSPEEDGTITAVIQKGYALHGASIREPKVEVAVME